MKLVKEYIEFKRGIEPSDAMGTGIENEIIKWIEDTWLHDVDDWRNTPITLTIAEFKELQKAFNNLDKNVLKKIIQKYGFEVRLAPKQMVGRIYYRGITPFLLIEYIGTLNHFNRSNDSSENHFKAKNLLTGNVIPVAFEDYNCSPHQFKLPTTEEKTKYKI